MLARVGDVSARAPFLCTSPGERAGRHGVGQREGGDRRGAAGWGPFTPALSPNIQKPIESGPIQIPVVDVHATVVDGSIRGGVVDGHGSA